MLIDCINMLRKKVLFQSDNLTIDGFKKLVEMYLKIYVFFCQGELIFCDCQVN